MSTQKLKPSFDFQFFGMRTLYISISLMIAGNTLQTILLLSRASVENFSTVGIGFMSAFYYLGWVLGCYFIPIILANVGHIRVFTALASIASSIVIGHVIFVEEWLWVILRFFSGLSLAGLFVVIESWLSELAPDGQKARAFSIYRVIDIAATIAGQFLLMVSAVDAFEIYGFISVLLSLSLVPVALSKSQAPGFPIISKLNLIKIYHHSPQAMVGCVISGICFGSYWGFAPAVNYELTGNIKHLPLFMAMFSIGGFIAQYLVGPVADRFNTRTVLTSFCFMGIVFFVIILGINDLFKSWYFVASFLAGVAINPLYSLCVAHANDRVSDLSFVEVSSGLLIAYGVGAAIGPMFGVWIFNYYPRISIFILPLIALTVYVSVCIKRIIKSDPVPLDEQTDYVAVGRTMVNFELDPRSEDNF